MIDKRTIQHIASLARLKLTDKEEDMMRDKLSSTLDYVNQLREVNTDSTEPLYQTTGLVNSFRPDEHRGDFNMDEKLNEKLVGQAPTKQERFVKVKSVLNK